jgi:hypothetical protein
MHHLRSPGYILGYLYGLLLDCIGVKLSDGGIIHMGFKGDRLVVLSDGSENDPLNEARSVEELLSLQLAQYQAEEDRRFFEG